MICFGHRFKKKKKKKNRIVTEKFKKEEKENLIKNPPAKIIFISSFHIHELLFVLKEIQIFHL